MQPYSKHSIRARGSRPAGTALFSKLTLVFLGIMAILAIPGSLQAQNINSSVAPNINGSDNSVDIKNNSGGDWYFFSNPTPSAATMSRISGLTEFPWPSSVGNFAPDPTDEEQNRLFPGEFLRVYPNTIGVGNTIQIPFSYSPSGTKYNFEVVVEAGAQVTSLNIADGNPTSAATVHWTVTFDQPVSGVTAGNFAFNNPANISGLTITSVTPSGSQPAQTWTVTAGTGTGNGILGLNWSGHKSETPSVPNSFTGQYYDFSFYPIISQYPTNAGVNVGTTTTMSVAASLRGPGSLNYQWYSGTSVTPNSATLISGATSSSYTPPVFNTLGSFQYFCRVTSTPGTYTDSTTAIITVVTPPQITAQPQNTIVAVNQPATFSVTATGSSLNYQWYQGEAPDTSLPVGGNSPVFTSPHLGADAIYWVQVSNPGPTVQNSTTALAAVVADLVASEPGYKFSVNTAYPVAFSVTVTDPENFAIPGVPITFTAPASGASGLFAGNTTSVTVNSDANGVAISPAFTANSTAGAYTVVAKFSTTSVNLSVGNHPVVSSPSSVTFFAGLTNRFSFTETGITSPIYSHSGNLPSGISFTSAGTLTGTPAAGSGGVYPLIITVGNGPLPTGNQNFTLTVVEESSLIAPVTFNNNGLGWALNGDTVNGGPIISDNGISLTDGTAGENRSAWFRYPVYVGGFKASFIYIDILGGGADGVGFVVQNSAAGTGALGFAGGSLGYCGITNSVAFLMNLYSGAAGGASGVMLGTNGIGADNLTGTSSGRSYQSTLPEVYLDSGDPFQVNLVYSGGILEAVLTDLGTGYSFTNQYPVDIPAFAGTNEAYIGITGSEGGVYSRQLVSTFSFESFPSATTVAATGIIGASATVGGIVNPNGPAANAFVLWGATPSFGNTNLVTSLAAGFGPQNISATLAGLSPGTTYYYTVMATNSAGSVSGAVMSFATPAAPAVTTLAADEVTGTSVVLTGTVNPEGSPTTVSFAWGTSASLGNTADVGTLTAGSTAANLVSELTDLTPGTKYYYAIVASNIGGLVTGATLSFTNLTVPIVTTLAASGLTGTSATLNGTADPKGLPTDASFAWGTTTSLGNTNLAASLPAEYASPAVSSTLTGLAPGTKYYYSVVASSAGGTVNGSILSFTTPVLPVVSTSAATGVTSTSATLNGIADPKGLATVVSFAWGTSASFGHTNLAASLPAEYASPGVSNTLTGLTPGTTYFYAIVASNAGGVVVGAVASFTTATPPVVTTVAAGAITGTSAMLKGTVNPEGSATAVSFAWGTSASLGNTNAAANLSAGTTAVGVSNTLAGLTAGTKYYYAVVASNAGGMVAGSVLSFTTPVLPVVHTLAAVGVAGTSATLNGSVDPKGVATIASFAWGTSTSFGHTNLAASLPAEFASPGVSNTLTGLIPGTKYYYTMVASNAGGVVEGTVLSFTTPVLPVVHTAAAGGVAGTSATLNGTVDPKGLVTTASFVWGTNTSFGNTNLAANLPAEFASPGVSNTLAGLLPGTKYYFAVVASNAGGVVEGTVLSFTTLVLPVAHTLAASGVTETSATLNGTVDPKGLVTTASFVWGTTANFGNTNLVANLPAEFASPGVSNTLAGLLPGTKYYYSVVASNAAGVVAGNVLSFTTAGSHDISDAGKPVEVSVTITGVSNLPDGTRRIELAATPGQTYVIEAASDPTAAAWTAIGTNTAAADGSITFIDPQSANAPSRFYRLRNP